LIRQKVVLQDVDVEQARVELLVNNVSKQLHIAEAFTKGKNPDTKEKKEAKGDWSIFIQKARLSNIHFYMSDSISGIYILQEVGRAEIKDFLLAIAEREFRADALEVENVYGRLTLRAKEPLADKNEAPPWNFGLLNLSMDHIDFTFDQGKEALWLNLILGEGKIKAKEVDVLKRVLDLKDFTLAKGHVTVVTPFKTDDSLTNPKMDPDNFGWLLKGRNMDFENLGLSIKERDFREVDSIPAIFTLSDLEMKMKGFILDGDQAGAKLNQLSFHLDNGFSMTKLKAEIDSDRELTKLQMDLETGNSQVSLEGRGHSGLLSMIMEPGHIPEAHLDITNSRVSLLDVFPFLNPEPSDPLSGSLSQDPFTINAQIGLLGSKLDVSGLSLSQGNNFKILLEGKLYNFVPVSTASSELLLGISEVDPVWLKELLLLLGMEDASPDLSGLDIAGQISGSLFSPDVSLELQSQAGNLSTSGSVDFVRDSFVLASYTDNLNLGALLDVAELGSFTGSARLSGLKDRSGIFQSNVFLSVDSLGYKDYIYQYIRLEGQNRDGIFDFHLLADDEHAKGDLRFQGILRDKLFRLNTDGNLSAQLDQLHLMDDTLALQTRVEGYIIRQPDNLKSDITLLGTELTNAHEKVEIEQLHASIQADSATTTLRSAGDFFELDMQIAKSIYEFDSLGQAYGNYLATFRDSDPENAASRLMELPEINAKAQVRDHDVLDIILKDTGFHMTILDLSMIHELAENKINYGLKGDAISYKMTDIETVNAEIIDSAGLLNVRMALTNASLFSGPENDWLLDANFAENQGATSLTVKDYKDRLKYEFEIAASLDSGKLDLGVPAKRFIINRQEWDLESSELLSVDLSSYEISPALRMFTDSSSLYLLGAKEGDLPVYTLIMNQVEMESLLREDLFPGRPDASITGSMALRFLSDSARMFESDLHFSDVGYSDLHFDQISLSGKLEFDDSGSYEVDMQASLDSARASFQGKKTSGGERVIQSEISKIPLNTLQPFTSNTLSNLRGLISGRFTASNTAGKEDVSGQLRFDDVQLKVDALNASFRIPDQNLVLEDEKLIFNQFRVLDTLNHELLVDGFLDFQSLDKVSARLDISSSRLQVMSSREVANDAPFYGDVYVDSRFSVNGPIVNPTIRGNIRLARGTEVFYNHTDDLSLSESEQIVNFVSDAEQKELPATPAISPQGSLIQSSVETTVEIDPRTRFNVGLSKNIYELELQITGGGRLMYNMLNNSQMSLLGRYEIREGGAELKLVGWPDKSFRIAEGGFISWDGRVDNPELNVQALNRVSSSYLNPVDGKQRPVDFDVILQLSGYLADLDVLFTVSASDQYLMSTINALGPEEQMRQAISILLFEAIDLPGISSSSDYMSQQVNQILASQLNQLTSSAFKGVDISFGIDTYNSSSPGNRGQSSTTLSYEVRKSLMNDRAQIEVSGRMQDVNQQPGASNLSLSNITFEYSLDSAATRFLKVYNEHTYEDVFEGEVIKTGIGIKLRRQHRKFSDIWKREKKRKKEKNEGK